MTPPISPDGIPTTGPTLVPAKSTPARVLLTSAGSLVGRCVLDALAGRREGLMLIGGELDPTGPTVLECDAQVQLPPSDSADFVPAVEEACRTYEADLVIPCRDPDVLQLAAAQDRPGSPIRLASPSLDLVAMTQDKWLSYNWCRQRNLPFAPTVCTDTGPVAASDLVARWGLPLIAKPRAGSGSLGVRVISTAQQLGRALAVPGYVIQPYLDPPEPRVLDLDTSAGVPLFWEVPTQISAVMLVLGPDGSAMPPVCMDATLRLGRLEALQRRRDPDITAFADYLLDAFRRVGWRGPLAVQLRPSGDSWGIIELNPRFSGATSSRLWLGSDEVAWVINLWLGRAVVPAWTGRPVDRVIRILADHPGWARPLVPRRHRPPPRSGAQAG